jgi:hypothetical protein
MTRERIIYIPIVGIVKAIINLFRWLKSQRKEI